MAINSVEGRDSRRNRTRVFKYLELAGNLGAFASNIRFPSKGRDLDLVLDNYSNLLIPALEKLFPSKKETHRQNIVSVSMHELEEVPFGTDLTKVILIPKKAIAGILQDHKVRISQICPFTFQIEVAVINRDNRQTVSSGVRQ
ncbi:MAG: hypothetical protein ACT4O9_13215 [Blastocatellia bacterium]